MQNSTHSQTVYIVAGDPALSLSAKCLLEARNTAVELFADAGNFLSQTACSHRDTVLLDLDPKKPVVFRLLNELLYSPRRPRIVVTTPSDSPLKSNDVFPGARIQVLVHPVNPGDLVNAVDSGVGPYQ